MIEDLIKYIHNEDIISEENCKIFLVIDTDLSKKRIEEIREIETICTKYNVEIITSAPTFEIWYIMHYRNNKLMFQSSKEVKKELQKLNGAYTENLDMYKVLKDSTDKARKNAKAIENQIIKRGDDLLDSNPHTGIYKILDTIDKFNKLNIN